MLICCGHDAIGAHRNKQPKLLRRVAETRLNYKDETTKALGRLKHAYYEGGVCTN